MTNRQWLLCPRCGGKTRVQVRPDTKLVNFPLFCPKCKGETLISLDNHNLIIVKEPDANDTEPMTSVF